MELDSDSSTLRVIQESWETIEPYLLKTSNRYHAT